MKVRIGLLMYDIIIKNGTIIDGTGRPMFSGDVGIKEEKIETVGGLHNEYAKLEIDAKGQYVVPGFVDINNHSDTYWRIFDNPELPSLIYQGITTIIGGNCGSSLAPLVSKDIINTIQKWTDVKKISLNWLRIGEFLEEVEKKKISVNFGTLVGHSTLRRGVIGDAVKSLNNEEVRKVRKMLKDAMKEGALGISTGLVYTHAKSATEKEIKELAEIAEDYGGVYTTHIRGEKDDLIASIEEAIRVAQTTGIKLQISHLKAMGEANWHLMDEAFNLIENARTGGIEIDFDVYPYSYTGSVLYTLLPDWVSEGGKGAMLSRLKDPAVRANVISEMIADSFDFSKVFIAISPLNKNLNNKSILEIARSRGESVEGTIIDILLASEGRVITMLDVLSEKNVEKAILHPFSIISSNGAGYDLQHFKTGEHIHPRNFGSFPRVLGMYCRDKKTLSWEEAVRKMSGKPAEKFGIKKRGAIIEGNFADVVVFDPERIKDLADKENPYQYPVGINWVMVNGKVALENGKYNGARAGEIIRR